MAPKTTSLDHTIGILSALIAEMESQAMQHAEFGELSMRQVLYLQTIAEMDRPTFGELAERLKVSKPSVTAIVTKLIQKGKVTKEQSNEDRRTFHIVLTEKGTEFIRMHQAVHQEMAQFFTNRLSENELQQLTGLLEKVLQGE
jgi:DNA-binding MarR family transcriptional regulator